MFYKANMKFDGMKNYAVRHSDKENILFEAMQQEPCYDNNATQYLFVDPYFFDLINDDYNRYYEHEIYYDCQSNYADDEPMYCQNLCKRQSLRMSEVLNEIVRPKEFKKVLKQMSFNSNTLYRSFRQAYRRAKKTRKSSTKMSGLKCKCMKCGGGKSYDEFLIEMNQGDMNPWDIKSVELPPYHQQPWNNIGDGMEIGKDQENIDVNNDIETYCMWLNQKHSKCCRSWESHSMKSKPFHLANNQTIDNGLHQSPSSTKEIHVCNKTDDVLPKEQEQKDINQCDDVNDKTLQYVTYSCTPVASTKTINKPDDINDDDNELSKVMPICLMIPLNIKIDSQEGQLHSGGVEFMTDSSKAKQNQIFVCHESTMECTILPEKPKTLQERITEPSEAKKIENPIEINPQPQQAIQIEQEALKPNPIDTIPLPIDLVANEKSSEIQVDSNHSIEIQEQLTKDNQSYTSNEIVKLPSPVDTTTEQIPSASTSNVKPNEMKTTNQQNESHTNVEKIPTILKNTLGPEPVQENNSLMICPCTKIINPALQPPKTLNQTKKVRGSLHPAPVQDIKSTRSCPCLKTVNPSLTITQLPNDKSSGILKNTSKSIISCPCTKLVKPTVSITTTHLQADLHKNTTVQPPKVLNQPKKITGSLRPDKMAENKTTTVQLKTSQEPVRMPEDKMKLVPKPLPTIYETMPLTISESQQFGKTNYNFALPANKQSVTEIVQTNISTVEYYKRKSMGMEPQQVSDSKELSPKTPEISKQSVTESVQTDISSVQHYKRKEMRTEIRQDLEDLLQPNPSTSKQIYDSDERDEILLDIHRLFHPEQARTLPDDLSRQKAIRDLNYIVKPESATGITATNSKLPESQDSILAGIRHMLSPQPGPHEKTKRRRYHKQTKEKILEDLQIFLKPVRAKPSANKALRNSVLSDLRFMLVTGDDKTLPNRPRHSFSSYQNPSTSSNSSIMLPRPPRRPEVIQECIITDCRYLPNSTSHLEKRTIDDLETAAQFYQRQLGFDNQSAIFFQRPLD